jgi:predicted transcriptional regulator
LLLLSIHPRFVHKIFSGGKSVELRKRIPRCVPGDWIAVYSTTPEKELAGVVRVVDITVTDPRTLWQLAGRRAGVDRQEYDAYFGGARTAVGIRICCPRRLNRPVSLEAIKEVWPGFHPPQGYIYLSPAQVCHLQKLVDPLTAIELVARQRRNAA